MTDSHSSFPNTQWTLLKRVREGSELEVKEALNTLCRAYWYPLYSVARQKQLAVHDAQDMVQGFFECLLRREVFATADETKGKLRQLLLSAFDNYSTQQWHHQHRQKRGGGAEHVEFSDFIDVGEAERKFLRSGAGNASIEQHYNREWASTLTERSLMSLRDDYDKRGWLERYEMLVGPLMEKEENGALAYFAEKNGVTPANLRVMLHRMRLHFREKIERELAATLDSEDPAAIREEMMELFNAFA